MNNIYRQFKPIVFIVLSIFAITTILEVIRCGGFDWPIIKEQLFYNAYYGIPLTIIVGSFFDYADRILSWDDNPRFRVLVGIIGTIVVTMVCLIILNTILWVFIQGEPFGKVLSREKYFFYLVGLLITVIVTIIMHALGFYQEVQKQKDISYQLEKEKLSSELNALKAHVDPHFLFNSFNVLSGLIDEDAPKAQDFLSGLSRIYRYVLEQRNEDTSKLENELAFANRYLALQKTRFEEGIEIKSHISKRHLTKEIPSLTLQLLLENAIKHNAFDKGNPLVIHMNIVGDDSS